MIELLQNIRIRCKECGCITEIPREEIEFESFVYDHGDSGMGEEIEYSYDGCVECSYCRNTISFGISGFEYPIGAFDYEDSEIEGGCFEEKPHLGIVYSRDDFDYETAVFEYTRIERLIMKIDRNPELVYDITSREFEEIVERLFQDEGFETKLTQATRDGGRDIIATKYEMGKPIVFYIECKKYGKRNSAGVNIVRSLLGVQSSDKINKSILVTTGHVTRDAQRLVEKQNTMMSVINADEFHSLIRASAKRYRGY